MAESEQLELLKQAAKALYEQGLCLLLEKTRESGLDQRVIWRVEMDSSGIITACTKRLRRERPRPGTFLFIVPEGGKPPVFGNFASLQGHQIAIATALKSDVARLVQTNEIAYCLSQAVPSAVVQRGMRELSNRFGELPVPSAQVQNELALQECVSAARQIKERENIVKAIPKDVFEQFVERERKHLNSRGKRNLRRAERALCKTGDSRSSLLTFTYRYFTYHYLLNNRRYQYIQVYAQPHSQRSSH